MRQGHRLRPLPVSRVRHQHRWLELALAGIDLLAWARVLLLQGALAVAEPKKLRYRLLHTAARMIRGQRRRKLRIPETWPWAEQLRACFLAVFALPPPTSH